VRKSGSVGVPRVLSMRIVREDGTTAASARSARSSPGHPDERLSQRPNSRNGDPQRLAVHRRHGHVDDEGFLHLSTQKDMIDSGA